MEIKKIMEKPKRTCQTMHECDLCLKTIHCGEEYFDGGIGNRIHVKCGEQWQVQDIGDPKGGD